jgi:hypothetical protein
MHNSIASIVALIGILCSFPCYAQDYSGRYSGLFAVQSIRGQCTTEFSPADAQAFGENLVAGLRAQGLNPYALPYGVSIKKNKGRYSAQTSTGRRVSKITVKGSLIAIKVSSSVLPLTVSLDGQQANVTCDAALLLNLRRIRARAATGELIFRVRNCDSIFVPSCDVVMPGRLRRAS